MSRGKLLMAAAAGSALFALASPASAAVTLTKVPGQPAYAGPFTYDFDTPPLAPISGGNVAPGAVSGVRAIPLGSTGNYWSIGPSDGPGILDLGSRFASVAALSFIWGSVDDYNLLEVYNRGGTLIGSFGGTAASAGPFGDHTDPNANPFVTLTFTDADTDVGKIYFKSTQNAFEVDNFLVTAGRGGPGPVPEPATWAMMLLGFGAVGFGLRKRKATRGESRLRVAYS